MSKRILIVGAGLTGCTFAKLLKEQGYDVSIKEKESYVGGLCHTKTSPNGFLYEPCGARTFHTKRKRVKDFVTRFAEFRPYTHWKGIILHHKFYHFPISLKTVKELPEADRILKELDERPEELDRSNFETCMISLFGQTLYKLFIQNYTKKMWGDDARNLTADWAPKRMELRETNTELFVGQWQGQPVGGYTEFLKEMIRNIPIEMGSSFNVSHSRNYDMVVFSGRIDELLRFIYGTLPYRSLIFNYEEDGEWEDNRYGTINLPEHPTYIRKANFKVFAQNSSGHNWIQYQKPTACDENNLPMYPVSTKKNNELFDVYLAKVCQLGNILPAGRLGLYKYLDMDAAVSLAMRMVNIVGSWGNMSAKQRFDFVKEVKDDK